MRKGDCSDRIDAVMTAQKAFFESGATRDVKFRKEMLRALAAALVKWEPALYDALYRELHKSEQEAFLTEISLVRQEIRTQLRHIDRWAAPASRPSPLSIWPSRSRLRCEPLGNVLIVAPWNYPVQLLLNPLAGAISAGCTAILKPSPAVPAVSAVLETLVRETFNEEYIAVIQGHREVNAALFSRHFDLLFLTGSPELGRTAMKAAAEHLTPVILELGGKSPCLVDATADLEVAARRIVWGKTINCGQTCIAPDYLLVHRKVKAGFTAAFARQVKLLHGEDPSTSPHYGRMVNLKAFDRVAGYLSEGRALVGGHCDRSSRYIEPTLLEVEDTEAPVMREEIFGPVLPMLEFEALDEAVEFIRSREKPLALYYFGKAREGRKVLGRTASGGACLNDTLVHFANGGLPFGGVGDSGMGRYHGRDSFLAFSCLRPVVESPAAFDLPFRYMPYRYYKGIKRLL